VAKVTAPNQKNISPTLPPTRAHPHQQNLKPAVRNRHLRHEHRPKGPNRKRAADTEHKRPTTFFFNGRNDGEEEGETQKYEARITSQDTLGVICRRPDQAYYGVHSLPPVRLAA